MAKPSSIPMSEFFKPNTPEELMGDVGGCKEAAELCEETLKKMAVTTVKAKIDAMRVKLLYDALREQEFTEDQAVKIVCALLA